ncbi:MAG: ABC transporter ATP-binding protein [Melioribacteraceae bacterium]|nr:ABC transporter ATP-binding protein [Melioribacteraceae bacterium]
MLELDDVSKSFGNFLAVKNIKLKVNKGDLYGFLGPNGAGKTTTIKMITGLYKQSSGRIYIDGKDISNNDLTLKSKFGYIPDQPFLYDKLTGIEYLMFAGSLYGINSKTLKSKIDELIDILKFEDWIHKRTEEYSQGMKQRITIASAFIHDPDLIIIDEPMVGLDPQSAAIVKHILVQKSQNGKAVFVSTHSLNVVEEICNKVAIIKKGELIFDDSLSALQQQINEHNPTLEKLFIELTNSDE